MMATQLRGGNDLTTRSECIQKMCDTVSLAHNLATRIGGKDPAKRADTIVRCCSSFIGFRKPPAMLVGASRKIALASSIERSESRITIQKIRMHSIKTPDARLRAAGHLMQVKNHSVHL